MKRIYNTLTQTFSEGYSRADDEPVEALEAHLQIYDLIETPPPEISATQYLTPTATPDDEAKTLTLGWQIHDRPALPLVVPFRSLAFALRDAGLYQQVKAAALSTEEGEIWWTTAQSTTVRRDHEFVNQLGAAIGQTSQQLDEIFAAAAASPQA